MDSQQFQRTAGVMAGIGYIITLAGVIMGVTFGVGLDLIVPGDPAATVNAIAAEGGGFRVGIIGWLIAILGDLFRAWALYLFFRIINRSAALLSAWWMLLHDAVFAATSVFLVIASDIARGTGTFASFGGTALQPLLLVTLEAKNYGFRFGLFFFSFHLLVLGYLALKAGFIPKWVGILALIAGVGYFVDTVAGIALVTPPQWLSGILGVPNFIGELALVGWVALRGGKMTGTGIKRPGFAAVAEES